MTYRRDHWGHHDFACPEKERIRRYRRLDPSFEPPVQTRGGWFEYSFAGPSSHGPIRSNDGPDFRDEEEYSKPQVRYMGCGL